MLVSNEYAYLLGAARGKPPSVSARWCVSVCRCVGVSDCTRACVWQRREKLAAISGTPLAEVGGDEGVKSIEQCAH